MGGRLTNEVHVEVLPPEVLDGWVRIRAAVRGHPRRTGRNGVVFFDVPADRHGWTTVQGRPDDLHDAFLRATVWSAMEAGGELTVHGRVSERLLANLERYQEIVCRWWPEYHVVRVRADEELDDAAAAAAAGAALRRRDAVLAFSGGLDSVEALAAHQGARRGRNSLDVSACLFVHGFDIPLDDGAFSGALARARRLTARYSTELFVVRSNLKELLPLWETTFSAGIAAVLSLFERRFGVGLLAASSAYENEHWIASKDGSTPWSDPLLSSSTFRLVPDLAVTRVEKTERLAGDDGVWRDIRVCWEGEDLSTNCGRCEKCVRQMLCMHACGIGDFSAFAAPLTPATVLATRLPMPVVVEEWRRCYEHACASGRGGAPVFVAAKRVLDAASHGAPRGSRWGLGGIARRVRRRARRLWRRRPAPREAAGGAVRPPERAR
jgi:hypothetical protein